MTLLDTLNYLINDQEGELQCCEWDIKEDPRPSYATMQWDKCVRGMHERLWEKSE